ncbi:hypothetical protein Mic7113_0292 [Allocoleopsis franciscana PCC 7113]|uniref:Uncharacterized protein n=1 Tax=Allocoleopsis franciscana PCC 7113 TaxID=1173027 RepID=K9W9P6_9CYAN|nr:hypothetical protein Mic7113_0292 [Allocoleopsis franciscana PCC 7113]
MENAVKPTDEKAWDTKFISLPLDWVCILSQTPVSATIRRYVTLFVFI